MGKVSAAAVTGCQMIWREVMQLWAADQETIRKTLRHHRTARRLTRLDVTGAPAAERDPSILDPLHRRAYDQAVIYLRMDREKLLTKRSLTHSERRLMGWEGWTAKEVVAWWHTKPSRRLRVWWDLSDARLKGSKILDHCASRHWRHGDRDRTGSGSELRKCTVQRRSRVQKLQPRVPPIDKALYRG